MGYSEGCRDAPVAAHACACRRWPFAGGGRGGRSRRARGKVTRGEQVSHRWQRAVGGIHMCGQALALCRRLPGRAVASRERHRRAGLAAVAPRGWRHTQVRPGAGPLPAVARECGRSRELLSRAGLAAVAKRRWRVPFRPCAGRARAVRAVRGASFGTPGASARGGPARRAQRALPPIRMRAR